jgi:hypothetical protein
MAIVTLFMWDAYKQLLPVKGRYAARFMCFLTYKAKAPLPLALTTPISGRCALVEEALPEIIKVPIFKAAYHVLPLLSLLQSTVCLPGGMSW